MLGRRAKEKLVVICPIFTTEYCKPLNKIVSVPRSKDKTIQSVRSRPAVSFANVVVAI